MILLYLITLPQMTLNGHCLGLYFSLLAKDHNYPALLASSQDYGLQI